MESNEEEAKIAMDMAEKKLWDNDYNGAKHQRILGGPKNEASTVISPKQYKRRFRKAVTTYFLMVPNQWSPPTVVANDSRSDQT